MDSDAATSKAPKPKQHSISIKRVTICLACIFPIVLAVSIILPLINRERQRNSNRPPGIVHLHQIGLGILLYSEDHQGRYPDTLADLITTENMSPEVLIDPQTEDTPAQGKSAEEIKASIKKGGHQTFIYLGAGLTDKAGCDTVVAYEIYTDGSCDVLFGDGHTVWMNSVHTHQMLQSQSTTRPTTIPIGVGSEG